MKLVLRLFRDYILTVGIYLQSVVMIYQPIQGMLH